MPRGCARAERQLQVNGSKSTLTPRELIREERELMTIVGPEGEYGANLH
jgi:hypothetical protein